MELKMKTIYANIQKKRLFHLNTYPNAGPHCNITGMKAKYWGKNAHCVKSGAFVYKIPEDVYYKILRMEL
jgi:hypothetical protein